MKKFLHEFFNPPKVAGSPHAKIKTGKKKVSDGENCLFYT